MGPTGAHFPWAGLPDAVACGAGWSFKVCIRARCGSDVYRGIDSYQRQPGESGAHPKDAVCSSDIQSILCTYGFHQPVYDMAGAGRGRSSLNYKQQAGELRKRLVNMKRLYLYEPRGGF